MLIFVVTCFKSAYLDIGNHIDPKSIDISNIGTYVRPKNIGNISRNLYR